MNELSDDKLSLFTKIADDVYAAAAGETENGNLTSIGNERLSISITGIVDTITYLIGIIPNELYQLRKVRNLISGVEKVLRNITGGQNKGSILSQYGRGRVAFYEGHVESNKAQSRELSQKLGILAEGASGWIVRMDDPIKIIRTLDFYGLYKKHGYTVAQQPNL